jgi:hypothetical protein
MSTRPSPLRPRRYRPFLALVAGLLLALATSGTPGLAVPAEGLGMLGELRESRPCGDAAGAAPSVSPSDTSLAPVPRRSGIAPIRALSTLSASASPDVASAALDELPAADASTGLDLEVRIGRIHIEFPWLKALPISPGRHVVLELMPARGADAR